MLVLGENVKCSQQYSGARTPRPRIWAAKFHAVAR